MASKTYGPKYYSGKEQLYAHQVLASQPVYNNGNQLSDQKKVKLTQKRTNRIAPSTADPRIYAIGAPKQITLNPYTHETLFQLHKQKERQEQEAPVLASGMTSGQWRNINEFQIVGQSHRKKQNYHIAIEHYFNLRAMYRKINQIRFKKTHASEVSTSQSLHKNPNAMSTPPSKIARVQKKGLVHRHHHDEDEYYHQRQLQARKQYYEPASEKKKAKARPVSTPKVQSAVKAKGKQQVGSKVSKLDPGPVKKRKPAKTKIRPKKKAEFEEPEEDENEQITNVIAERNKKLAAEDFKNTNEKELIAENLGLLKKAKRDVDFDDFVIEQRMSAPKDSKKPALELLKADEEDPIVKYGDFLHKAKDKDSNGHHRIPGNELLGSTPQQPIRISEQPKKTHSSERSADKSAKRNSSNQVASNPMQAKPQAENGAFSRVKAQEAVEAEKVNRSQDSENFELTNFHNKIGKPLKENNGQESEEEDDDIMAKIPVLSGTAEDDLNEFKTKLVEMIFAFEIFSEEEFNNFFEAVCVKNEAYEQDLISEIFNEVKEYLYEQFQNFAEEGGELEEDHDNLTNSA